MAQSHMNEKSSNSQDLDSQFMSSPIQKNNKQSNKPEFPIIFRVGNSKSFYILKCTEDNKVSDIIEKYRNKSGDKESRLFIFKKKILNPDLTASEAGISNNANIFVVLIRTVVFRQILSKNSAVTPIKIQYQLPDKVSDIIEKYRNKSGDKEKRLVLFNAKNLNPNLTTAEAGISNNNNIFAIPIITVVFKQILSKNSAVTPIKIQCQLL